MTVPSTTPTIVDVWNAKAVLAGVARLTPLLRDQVVDNELGTHLGLKAEHLQLTGAYKFRGMYNKVHSVREQARDAGVITASSGNAGQGVAMAAALLGIPASVVMPVNAAANKVLGVESLGARIIRAGTSGHDRFQAAMKLVSLEGSTYVDPSDQSEVIAGQGTVALEILESWPEVDEIIVPTSGGGLLAGVSLVVKTLAPRVRVVGVQPQGAPGIRVSLDRGRPSSDIAARTLADALAVGGPGMNAFALIQKYTDDVVLVSDDSILAAMRWAFLRLHSTLEPAGAAALAALLTQDQLKLRNVCVVATGANVDPELLLHAIQQQPAADWRPAGLGRD